MLFSDGIKELPKNDPWCIKMELVLRGKYKSKYTREEKEEILKKNKVGKYREWEFNITRYNEIVDKVLGDHSENMVNAGIRYYRENYQQAQSMTDEEIIVTGLYKQMYRDKQKIIKELRREEKELEKQLYSEDIL